MNLLIQSVIKKSLSSLVKGLCGALAVCLTAFLSTPIPQDDKATVYIMALVMAGVQALISGLNRWKNFDISKITK